MGDIEKFSAEEWEEWNRWLNQNQDDMVASLQRMDYLVYAIEEKLQTVGLSCGYKSHLPDTNYLRDMREIFLAYKANIPYDINTILEDPLYIDYANHATEVISKISLDNISTPNPLSGYYDGYTVAKTLTFKDFLGINTFQPEVSANSSQNYVQEYADMFVKQYEEYLQNNPLSGEDLNDYLLGLYSQGEFENSVDKPFLSFLDSMIPFAGIWESITGKELLTGNVLSKDERITQGIIGTIDFVSLGICGYIAKSAKAVAKIFGINFLSNAAATTVSYVGDEVGFPKPVTLVLSVAVDGIFSAALGKHLIKPGVGSANYAKYLAQLDSFSENKIKHIINGSKGSNHGWENLVSDRNWNDIKNIIAEVMETGVESPYKSVYSKKAIINGFEVEVTYTKLSDGTLMISDAWVNP